MAGTKISDDHAFFGFISMQQMPDELRAELDEQALANVTYPMSHVFPPNIHNIYRTAWFVDNFWSLYKLCWLEDASVRDYFRGAVKHILDDCVAVPESELCTASCVHAILSNYASFIKDKYKPSEWSQCVVGLRGSDGAVTYWLPDVYGLTVVDT